jgi:hypothetical protein
MRSLVYVLLTALILLFSSGRALAGTKEDCLEAHGRGQLERDKGQLSRARQTFLTCAQSSCPSIVQADCSRLSEDLAHMIPTVTFVARDASAADLPVTSVFVDEVLVTTRLDDGKSYDIDPGKHAVRYVHDGTETTIRVVLNQGEKGRVLVATFASPVSAPSRATPSPAERAAEQKRPMLPLAVAGIGAAAVVTGAVMTGVGLARVPSSCTISTNECTAPANDPALEEAGSGVSLANAGLGIGIAGAVVLAGGIVWYLLQPVHPAPSRRGRVTLPYALSF